MTNKIYGINSYEIDFIEVFVEFIFNNVSCLFFQIYNTISKNMIFYNNILMAGA